MRVASIIRMFTEAGCVLSFGIFLMIAILNVSPLRLVAAVGAVIVREALTKGLADQKGTMTQPNSKYSPSTSLRQHSRQFFHQLREPIGSRDYLAKAIPPTFR
jgi:hypothetical protein